MSTLHIILIICAGLVFAVVSFITFISLTNRRKSKKLQENLNKYKQETKKEEEQTQAVTIAHDEKGESMSEEDLFSDDEFGSKNGGFFTSNKKEDEEDEFNFEEEFKDDREEELPRMPRKPSYREEMQKRKQNDAEFEKFLDEHAFSRKVFDKPLLEKIKKLPPEIKSIIMGNIFDKFNDDK